MKMLLRAIAVPALLAMVLAPVLAQEGNRPRRSDRNPDQERGAARSVQPAISRQLAELDLTPAQRQQTNTILRELQTKITEIRQSNATPEERRVKARSATAEAEVKISKVLTPEQRQKLRSIAQQGRPGGGMMDPATLAERLQLTPKQREQMGALSTRMTKERQELRASNLQESERAAKLQALRQRFRQDVEKILTPEQRARYSAMGQRAATGGILGIIGNLDALSERLKLTTEQRQRVAQILEKARPEVEKLRQQAANQGADRQALRERTQNLRNRVTGEVRSVLTAAQRAQLEQVLTRATRPGEGTRAPQQRPNRPSRPAASAQSR
jgi:Spy/CpxP family protein refolding chaperone